MSAPEKHSARRDTSQWERVLLKHELESLKREREHLDAKFVERPLTGWEVSRLSSIADELIQLLSQFGSAPPAQLNNTVN